MPTKILFAEDTVDLNRAVSVVLEHEGFEVTSLFDGDQASEALAQSVFDLVILDIMMPGKNGIEVLREMRAAGNVTPVILLTAKSEVDDRVAGLEAGADDYLCKPFDPKELLLRLNNLLKHQSELSQSFFFFFFSYENGYLKYKNKIIKLTTSEQNLLTVLAHSINQPVAREELARQTHTASARTIDTQIVRLRQKIEKDIKHPFWIQTVRGKGYKLVSS